MGRILNLMAVGITLDPDAPLKTHLTIDRIYLHWIEFGEIGLKTT